MAQSNAGCLHSAFRTGGCLIRRSNRQVASLLKEAGLDEFAIEAKAYTLVADDLENANRMSKSAREGRDKALRSIAKYRRVGLSSCGRIPTARWSQIKLPSLPMLRRIERGK